ncbi:unnamed protein product [Hermetia illucens]|uniref:Mpv17-like protein n=1 Tax=Hermetia illucens TaxID=343691 RepID=A0A7R8Z3A2_HERIL|nr:protein sym1 [Hermetia illucens]XP_037924775.1 protein sym1 [Hermetia illucens]XP_037924776.1 protein sym1 [Hermetia illucens]CAD7093708.1 unnamed protein product [Hermetia illucens]
MNIIKQHRIVRGMVSYALLWPVGNIVEQTLVERKSFSTIDWMRCLKFGLFGGFFVGPTLYLWMRLAGVMWPKIDVKSSLCKAVTEQVSYDPMLITTFLFGMSIFEGKSYEDSRAEVRAKFLETYRVGMVFWPIVQTVNFTFIPAKNQVIFTSFFSMLWSAFLAYMKHLQQETSHEDHMLEIHLFSY